MQLNAWLRKEKILPAQFADQIGETRQLVHNWLHRKHRPTLPKAIKVRDATDGEVNMDDWLPRVANGRRRR